MSNETIDIYGARENNLKDITLHIPKHKITVFTGVSGSGKTSLCIDTLTACSRRELNATFPSFAQQYLPKYGRPRVDRIEHLPVVIVIDQKKVTPNARSTVGTYTDTYALLRLLFSRVGKPFAGYSDSFSFNHPLGRCPRCDGLGEVTELDPHKLVDFDKCLNDEGVIHYAAYSPGQWRWIRYALSGYFDLDKKIKDYSDEELERFLYSPQVKPEHPLPGWPKTAKYEGLITRMYRSSIRSEEGKRHRDWLEPMVTTGTCPVCRGARLNEKVLACRIGGKNIAEVCDLAIPEILDWLKEIDDPLAEDLKRELMIRLTALCEIGLSYLSLARPVGTLSGGEAQRCKIARYINSSLSDLVYVLDEPSVGLHSRDIGLMRRSIQRLKDHGNTILLIEHHKEMIAIADHIVDLGPGSGEDGGRVLFEGSYEELLRSGTLTGRELTRKTFFRKEVRKPKGWFSLKDVSLHNLTGFDIDLPLGIFTVVAGVAGSGKSSLLESFRRAFPEQVIYVEQKSIGVNARSTPGTYLGAADAIRKVFSKENHVPVQMFTFNGAGACPVCGGKGIIVSDMAFMDAIETPCEMCGGLRYSEEARSYRMRGMNIAEAMNLSIREALEVFPEPDIAGKLQPMLDVGLGYLHLNQSLTTLSGGELQRLKLASFLKEKGQILILDEPTDGLHPADVRNLIALFQKLTDQGNTLFAAEHNLEVLKSADYMIELGPGGGRLGGRILYEGIPEKRDALIR